MCAEQTTIKNMDKIGKGRKESFLAAADRRWFSGHISLLVYLPTRIPGLVGGQYFGGCEGGVFRPYAHAVVYLLKEKNSASTLTMIIYEFQFCKAS